MSKISEICPRCGKAAPVAKTNAIPAMRDDNYKGWSLDLLRYQQLRCPACGCEGDRMILVSKVRWREEIPFDKTLQSI